MSTHSLGSNSTIGLKRCAYCKKKFALLYPKVWGYQRNTGKGILYFCSWHCKREEEKERDEMKKLTLDQKKKAVKIAVDGGNPLGFLESLGLKNAVEAWSKIKSNLKEFDPDTYAKLPKRLPQRTRHVSAPKPEKVELVYDPGIEAEYRAEHAETVKVEGEKIAAAIREMEHEDKCRYSWKPIEYETSAIIVKDLGEFYFDKKYNTIDWRAPDGAETSLTPEGWRHLHDSIPEMLSVLHANFEEVKQE